MKEESSPFLKKRTKKRLFIESATAGQKFFASFFQKRSLLFFCIVTHAQAAQTIEITGAWARATAPAQHTGAVYLSLTSHDGDVLTSVRSQDAGEALLHQTTSQNGMAGMVPLDTLPLPPGQTVRFEPRDGHVMLVDLKHALVAGGTVRLDLVFAKAGLIHLDIPVLPIGATGPTATAP